MKQNGMPHGAKQTRTTMIWLIDAHTYAHTHTHGVGGSGRGGVREGGSKGGVFLYTTLYTTLDTYARNCTPTELLMI